jgi:dienelactone hydrolase
VQQEIFGLNRQVRGICDLLAPEGYVTSGPTRSAPQLLHLVGIEGAIAMMPGPLPAGGRAR